MCCGQKVARLVIYENHLDNFCKEFSLDFKKLMYFNQIQLILACLVKQKT